MLTARIDPASGAVELDRAAAGAPLAWCHATGRWGTWQRAGR